VDATPDRQRGLPHPSESPGFSLMVGGPLYQLLERSRLLQPPLGFLQRRVIALTMIAWFPLLVLAAIDGRLLPGQGFVPFLYDIEGHVRLLVVLPLLLAAELPVHERLRGTIRQFIQRKLVPDEERPKFEAAVSAAMRVRNSVVLEACILVLAATAGHLLWRNQIAFEGTSWYATSTGGGLELTLPGFWYGFVAIPLFQFVGFRWYMRLAIWAWLLLRISRLRLNLIATHADRAAGLGFVGNSSYAFALLLLAHGALLSGWIADRVLLGGRDALDFQVESFVLVCCVVALIVAPLCVFAAPLLAAKRRARGEYGRLVSSYTQAFHDKWIGGNRPADEPMLGSSDMQSLADLATGYEIVQETRLVPFGLKLVTQLALITALPLLPLAFTILSFRNMIMQAIKIVI
jgi:hypothetical protein